MALELFSDKPENLDYREFTPGPVATGDVIIATEFGAIKHGTEFFLFSGKSPFTNLEFDMNQRMFVPSVKEEGPFVYRPGNMAVGTITEIGSGVTEFAEGDKVYCYSSLKQSITINAAKIKKLPKEMSASDAVCTDPSWFAFGAVRDARVRVGDTAVVVGLGAIGLLAVQFLKLSGCVEILAFDPIEKRRKLAEKFGATFTADPLAEDAGVATHRHLGRGADVALEISGSYAGLQSAMKSVAMCGRVVTVGFYKGNPAAIQLSMEWHHNRLELISSMPDWENPDRDYPLWDKARLQNTIIRLFCEKKLSSQGIVDPLVDFSKAKDAYLEVYKNPNSSVKLGVTF